MNIDWEWLLKIGSALGGFATLAGFFLILATAYIYWRQLHVMTKARQLESLLAMFQYINDIRFHRARYVLYKYPELGNEMIGAIFPSDEWRTLDHKVRGLSNNTELRTRVR